MITGDQEITALAIGRDLDIANVNSESLSGYRLSELSDEELRPEADSTDIYHRVTPEQKMRIVAIKCHHCRKKSMQISRTAYMPNIASTSLRLNWLLRL